MQQDLTLRNVTPFRVWKNESYTFSDTNLCRVSESNIPIRSIRILANILNTGYIYIGSENLTIDTSSIILEAGQNVEISIDNLNKLYFLATSAGDKIGYSWVIE